ncbi:MAG TPA: YibE/F family protein [Clostridiales bacterium UBA8153]|nr:YibE/F family protein [Clostridiales bacterium UBA8153]
MARRVVSSIIALVLLCLVPGTSWGQPGAGDYELPPTVNVRARVLEILSTQPEPGGRDFITERQLVRVVITSGRFRGRTIEVEHFKSGHPVYDIEVSPGDRVVLLVELDGDELGTAFIESPQRDPYMMYLAAGLLAVLLAVGGVKGAKAALSLSVMVLVVVYVLLPLLLRGYSPIPLTTVVAAALSALALLVVSGPNRKTLTAITGTTGGVLIAGMLAMKAGAAARLTGLSAEEAQMLMFIPQGIQFDYRGLLFAGIIIGALGAVMDVGMSVASAMAEVKRVNPEVTPPALFRSGMNVGRDVMATMSNTLILAYTGSAIPLLLLFMAYDTPLIRIANLDLIATEVVRALAGSIGLILAIPITALAGAYLLSWKASERGGDRIRRIQAGRER